MLRQFMDLLGLGNDDYDDDEEDLTPSRNDLAERKSRLMRPHRAKPAVIICREEQCFIRREDMAEALRNGQMLILDLHNVDQTVGQSTLDFICGVAYSLRGTVLRVAPAVFLITPTKNLAEEWAEVGDSDEDVADEVESEEEADPIE